MTHSLRRVFIIAVVIGLAVTLAGCEPRVSQASFEKIQSGMKEAEVREILGEPSETSSFGVGPFSGTSSVWKSKRGIVTIQFVNGKVTLKTFSKGER
jgi:outer membrane protein assembly factor BamE (lipoprotein component of BamABCDE complex)